MTRTLLAVLVLAVLSAGCHDGPHRKPGYERPNDPVGPIVNNLGGPAR